MKETVQVDVYHEVPEPGDVYLLCSDGLSGMVTDDNMARILSDADPDLDKKAERLIDAANENGGTDNITVILIRYESA
jgi:serine/threonine protein phosphatase PrpC